MRAVEVEVGGQTAVGGTRRGGRGVFDWRAACGRGWSAEAACVGRRRLGRAKGVGTERVGDTE